MEVHHHSHAPVSDSHHGGKKWTHYLWEFLMLFLAVFFGFMAENQREHIVEKKHEKQFMISLVKDLELDTLQLSRIQQYRLDRLADIDSLTLLFAASAPGTITTDNYNRARSLVGSMHFFQNSGTLDQLKNSGGLRLIHNRNIVDSIEAYDQQVKRIILRDQYENDLGMDNIRLTGKLFKNSIAFRMKADTSLLGKRPTANETIPINVQYIDEYLNLLMTFQDLIKANLAVQSVLKTRATNLIGLINNEYHLD